MAREFSFSTNTEKLIRAFESAPNETRRMVRIQLLGAVGDIQEYASDNHRYTSRSGMLERSGVAVEVSDNVGLLWLDTKKVPYAVYVHEGHKAMTIVPRTKKALRWVSNGKFVFSKRANIPAVPRDQFLYDAVDHEMPRIQKNFEDALQKLIEDL